MSFKTKLLDAARKNKSWLCVGLDTDSNKLPSNLSRDAEGILKFNRAVIESTSDLVCAYKPNTAFYERHGAEGWRVLRETILAVPSNIPVIVDAKRSDIGNTAAMYAKAIFEELGADAVTVNPYLGRDSIEPFASYMDKGVFILCLTSNKSSSEIQQQLILSDDGQESGGVEPRPEGETPAEYLATSTKRLYRYIAELAAAWNENDNLGLVVGATVARELGEIREIAGDDMPILVPGVGAQGGDLAKSIELGSNTKGELAIINVARGIIYAWSDESRCADEMRKAAASYRERIAAIVNSKASPG